MTTETRSLSTEAVNQFTAHRYSDTYAIIANETGQCIGCEHNATEADAVRRFADNRRSCFHRVERNTPDQVRAAKEFCLKPVRYQLRDEALREAGL